MFRRIIVNQQLRNLLLGFRPYVFAHPLPFSFLFFSFSGYVYDISYIRGTSSFDSCLLVVLQNEVDETRRRLDPMRCTYYTFIRALYKIIQPPEFRASLLLGKRQNWRKTLCAPQSSCWFIIKYIPLGTLFLRISPIYVSAWFNGLSSLYASNDAIVSRVT